MFYKVLPRHRPLCPIRPGPTIIETSLGWPRPDMNSNRAQGKMRLWVTWGNWRGKRLSQRDSLSWWDDPFTIRLNKRKWKHQLNLLWLISVVPCLNPIYPHAMATARRCYTSRQCRQDRTRAWMSWWQMRSGLHKALVAMVGRQATKIPTPKLPHRGTWTRGRAYPWAPQLYMALLPLWLWGHALKAP
jgi:hypothetical protein